jgi:hypothetical protein
MSEEVNRKELAHVAHAIWETKCARELRPNRSWEAAKTWEQEDVLRLATAALEAVNNYRSGSR